MKRTAPPTDEPAVSRGDRMRDERRWDDAVEAYGEHLADHPDDFGILVQMGNCAKEARDLPVALDAYMKARELSPDNADLNLQLGHLYKVMGRRNDAARYYGQALKLNANLSDARHELAVLATHDDGDDFTLPENVLDFVKADSVAELIETAKANSRFGDPFQLYGELVS